MTPTPPTHEPNAKQRKRDRDALQEQLQDAQGCLNEEWLDCVTFSWDNSAASPLVEAQEGLCRVIGKFLRVGLMTTNAVCSGKSLEWRGNQTQISSGCGSSLVKKAGMVCVATHWKYR
jgi:hypothetical protein